MRVLKLSLLLGALAMIGALNVSGQPAERDVKKLISEYVTEDCAVERRAEIVAKLKAADAATLQKHVKAVLKDDKTRGQAIALATELRVSGLFRDLKKLIDGVDESAVIKWILAVQEKDSVEFLFDRWKSVVVDEPSFSLVDAGFREARVQPAILDKFKGMLSDEVKGAAALAVLKWQMELGDDMTAAEIEAQWKDLRKIYERDYRVFPITGTDWFTLPKTEITRGQWCGRNLKLKKDALMQVVPPPDDFQKGDWILRFYVCVDSGNNCQIGMFTGDYATRPIGLAAHSKESEWVTYDSDGTTIYTRAPLKRGEWQEMKWELTEEKGGTRRCRLHCDGKPLIENGKFDSALSGFRIWAVDGEMLVGGIEQCKLNSKEKK